MWTEQAKTRQLAWLHPVLSMAQLPARSLCVISLKESPTGAHEAEDPARLSPGLDLAAR